MILYIRCADAVKAVQILGCFLEFSHSRPIAGIRQAKILPNVVDPHLEKTVAHFYNSIGGEHATTVNGNGVNPELDDILAVAQKIGLNMTMARKTALNIRDCVSEMLGEYL